jgi:hypothetical protein
MYNTRNVLVIFDAFEPIAKEEANQRVPEEKIQELKSKLNIKDLWEISRFFSRTTFFFYTDEQVEESTRNGIKERLAEEYYKLVKYYDDFDYINKQDFSISLDSKENFDKNYDSNWFYYYR